MFYGWKMSLFGSAGNFLIQGATVYIMNAFIDPLNQTYGWSRSDISTIMFFAAIMGAVCMPVFSSLALRFPLRLLMSFGAFMGGISAIVMGITDNLFVFGLCYVILWGSGQGFGGVSANILISKWFNRYKGRAFGICTIGTSLAGAVLPLVLMFLIEYTSVQAAWICYGLVILSFAPLCFLKIVEKPSDMGLFIDNVENSREAEKADLHISIREILRYKEVYYIGLTFGFLLTTSSSVLSQLKLRFTDIGMTSFTAMLLMCNAALFAGIAKYLWGWFCDKVNPILVTRLAVLCHIASLFLLFVPATFTVCVLFSVCFGLAIGGSWSVMPTVISFVFGKECFVSAYRVISPFIVLQAFGFLIVGIAYSLFGTYNAAYMTFIVILSGCFVLTLLLKPLQGKTL